MRHGDKVNNLGRTASHRKAMFRNLATSFLQEGAICTTIQKAKELVSDARGVAGPSFA